MGRRNLTLGLYRGGYLMSAKTPDAAGEWLVERYHQI
jgi:hypothetical protein